MGVRDSLEIRRQGHEVAHTFHITFMDMHGWGISTVGTSCLTRELSHQINLMK